MGFILKKYWEKSPQGCNQNIDYHNCEYWVLLKTSHMAVAIHYMVL